VVRRATQVALVLVMAGGCAHEAPRPTVGESVRAAPSSSDAGSDAATASAAPLAAPKRDGASADEVVKEPLFIYSQRSQSGSVDERLAIYPDGAVFHWRLRPDPSHGHPQDIAGTFTLPSSGARSQNVRALADALWGWRQPAATRVAPRPYLNEQMVESLLLVNHRGEQRRFEPLSPAQGSPPSNDPRVSAAQLGRALESEAGAHPLAAVRAGVKAPPAPAAGFLITLESIGTEAVTVSLRPGRLGLQDGAAVLWQGPLEGNTLGLLATQALLGGIGSSAVIPPGVVAQALVPVSVRRPLGPAQLELEANIEAPGPAGFPLTVQDTPTSFVVRAEAR
jgi:hypothetical protein